jgi:PepSY-associated transmembrane protein
MVKRTAIFLHRWLGVALCLLFLLWFPSGIGMMYWSFPAVTAADRLERSPTLDPSKVVLSPSEAAARVGMAPSPSDTRLNTFDSRPVYRFGEGRRSRRIVYADTGEEQLTVPLPRPMMDRIASAWTGQPTSGAVVEPVQAVDQWTVQVPLRNLRPLWKYSWPNGEQLYISGTSGEVVQYTTTASRIGAYLGPIPHWFYFTPLRKHQPEWSALVIWSSGIGTGSAILGVVIGVWMYSPSKRYRRAGAPTSIPYRGQKRWHTVLGLIFGVATATWAFSGMLSMDPFPSRSGGQAGAPGVAQALRGRVEMSAFAAKHPREALEQLAGRQVKELELTSFAGEPVYLATLAGGGTQIVPVMGRVLDAFDRERIIETVKKAAPEGSAVETRIVGQYDRYYLDRKRQLPLPVIVALMNDADHTRYYIDPKTARVVGNYSDRNWVNRWLYNGLHSLNFPWLYNYRPLWDIVVITFMLGGTGLCLTALVLAWQVLGRKLARLFAERPTPDDTRLREDVA